MSKNSDPKVPFIKDKMEKSPEIVWQEFNLKRGEPTYYFCKNGGSR